MDFHGKEIWKTVYLLVFPKGEILRNKLITLWDSFLGERYDIPKGDIQDTIEAVNKRIHETKQLILATQEQITKYLFSINQLEDSSISAILLYKWFVAKEKTLYTSLNAFKFGNSLLVGLFWAPTSEVENIYSKVRDIKEDRNITGPQIWERKNHNVPPPTYFRLNAFTASFQEITNTYGVPSYKEVNPTLFAFITFPFLFGVMFGDIGHGLLLFFFGIFMCVFSEDIQKTALNSLHPARYIILLMGFFSTFWGVWYNDFMSLPIEHSTWYHGVNEAGRHIGRLEKDWVVPIGVDHYWYLAENQLTYVNNMKMKISVIFGVTQMSLGIIMKAFNSIHFSKPIDFIFEFIPQLTLLLCLFGFMDLLIVVKWLYPWNDRTDPQTDPPGIIVIMINMFLKQGEMDPNLEPLLIDSSTQKLIWNLLIVIAFIWIPTMLLVKPIYLRWKMDNNVRKIGGDKDRKMYHSLDIRDSEFSIPDPNQKESIIEKDHDHIDMETILEQEEIHGEDHSFGEMFVHQMIETIEFALGTVSNTASYLRLWALSLAHSQLADVFFEKLLNDLALKKYNDYSFIMLFFLFPVFFSFTFFVLLWMDSMECFLHTLRLHWVEFQNKFYKGNGYLFNPLSFEKVIQNLNVDKS